MLHCLCITSKAQDSWVRTSPKELDCAQSSIGYCYIAVDREMLYDSRSMKSFHHFRWCWYLWQEQYLLYDNYWNFNLQVWCYHWDKTRRKVTRVLNLNANNKTELVARLSSGRPGHFQWVITDHLHGTIWKLFGQRRKQKLKNHKKSLTQKVKLFVFMNGTN